MFKISVFIVNKNSVLHRVAIAMYRYIITAELRQPCQRILRMALSIEEVVNILFTNVSVLRKVKNVRAQSFKREYK